MPPIQLTTATQLFDVLLAPIQHVTPLTFEALSQPYGFVLYATRLEKGIVGTLKIADLRDYAIVYINRKQVGVLERRLNQASLFLPNIEADTTLEILVEKLGRINFVRNY